ncbi:MAG TPA: hypothetical protein VES42_25890 [Pilimelia sp.]|nr:hypothetical protein [Pilimelia sp.]
MPAESQPSRRLIVAVDMEQYSRKDNGRQHRSQRLLVDVIETAVETLGLQRSGWLIQPTGDGELAILPAETPEPTIVGHLVPVLNRLLTERNRDLAAGARVRLRVAMHIGLVHLDGAAGYPGDAVVTACRLLDAAPLKQALTAFPSAAVGLIVSDQIYQDVVRHRYGQIRPERFASVSVTIPDKKFDASAWIFVPDEDVTTLPVPEQPAPVRAEPAMSATAADSNPGPAAGGKFHFGTVTTNGPTVFGDHGRASGSASGNGLDAP